MNNHWDLGKWRYAETENSSLSHIYFIAVWIAVTGLLCCNEWWGEWRGS
jgi:hypothetical protein